MTPPADTSAHTGFATGPTLDPAEVARFSKLAAEWWNPTGKFRPLHQIGPPRLSFIRSAAESHFKLDSKNVRALSGLTVLDIGCGGGLIAEPLARLGASVTGIDPSERNIEIAKGHAEPQGLTINYTAMRVEDLVAAAEQFDIVTCLEVVEHVPDAGAFVTECSKALKPGGLIVFSTINRTLKAWALAIAGAEYVLRWLPRGTHQWDRFVTPEELARYCSGAGLVAPRFEGMIYNPLRDVWTLAADIDVNYLASATKQN